MTRTAQPHEILISAIVLLGALISFTVAGYWLGYRGMDDIRVHDNIMTSIAQEATLMGYLDAQDEPIRINAECHNNSSDWATIRMANQIGNENDVPVFVHGNCLTHEVVDEVHVESRGGTFSCSGMAAHECADYLKKKYGFTIHNPIYRDSQTTACEGHDTYAQPSGNPAVQCPDGSVHEITDIPQPEGQ